jgi:hypothetical protein
MNRSKIFDASGLIDATLLLIGHYFMLGSEGATWLSVAPFQAPGSSWRFDKKSASGRGRGVAHSLSGAA